MDRHPLEPLFEAVEIDEGVISHLESLGAEGRKALLRVLEGPDDSVTEVERARAIYALSELGVRAAFGVFRRLLEDEAPTVRWSAMHGLAAVGGPNGVEPLLGVVTDAQRGEIDRAHALDALGRVGDEATVEEIERWAKDLDSFDLELAACKAVTEIRKQLEAIARERERTADAYCEP